MTIERVLELSETEYANLAGTDLYADLVSYKIYITDDITDNASMIITNSSDKFTGPWYFNKITSGPSILGGILHVSCIADAELILNEV